MKNGTKKYLSVLLAALLAVPAMTVSAAADAPKEKEKKELSHAVVHEKEKPEKEEKNPRFSSVSPMLAMEAAPMLMSSYAAPLSGEDDTADTVYVGETELQDGEWTADGLTESTGSLPASGYAYYKDGVLTLNNFKYEGAGYLWEDAEYSVPIYRDGSLEIKLEGTNALTTEATEYYPFAICAESLTISGTKDSTLDLEAYRGIYVDGGNVDISDSTVNINSYDYGIYSGENVSISESTVNIVSDYYEGLYVSGNVSILNSTVNIDAYDEDGIDASGNVSIEESTVNIDGYEDGIDASGNVSIEESTVNINSYDYGIYSGENVSISESTVNIVSDYYGGLYVSGNVSILNSTVNIDAYDDDGIYASGNVSIEESTVNIDAYYDGIDASGNVSIEESTVNINSYDYGIYSGENVSISDSTVNIVSDYYEGLYVYGNVSILNSTVNIDAYDEDGIDVYGDVSISESTVNIDAYYDGIYADGAVTISGTSSEITITSDWSAIFCSDVVFDDPLELLYPKGGSYSDSAIYIAAAPEGFEDHDCTAETAWYSDISGHWKACADPNCPIPKRAEFSTDYEKHSLYEEDDTCTTCGETYSNLIVGNHYLSDGEYLLNNGMSGTDMPSNLGYAYYEKGVLTLSNYIDESNPYNSILCTDDLIIVLEGENKLTSEEDTVDIEGNLTVKGSGSLEIDSGCCGLYANSEENSYDILIEGVSLTIRTENDAVDASGNITIKDSKLTVIAGSDGIDATEDVTIFESKLTITSEDEGLDGDENITVTDSELTIISEDEGLEADKNITVTNSTLTLTTDEDYLDYAGIYADTVEITDSTVTINSNCHGIYTHDSSMSYEELSDEVSDETAESGADITITRSNITIDAAYYTLRSETGITLIDCELPEGMEIAVVDDEYEDSSDFIPVMLSLTSEITDESNAGESTEEFENPIYTVVDADGQAVHHLIITYNKPADDPTEDTASPIPNLNLTGIRLIENGKTKTLPSAIGSRRTLTFTPAEGYCVADVLVNGKSVGAVETYTVVTVPGITVEVIYEEIEG